MFKESSDYSQKYDSSEDYAFNEVTPGVFDASDTVEKELAKEDSIFRDTLAAIKVAEDPRLRKLLEGVKNRMLEKYVDAKYKVPERGETYH